MRRDQHQRIILTAPDGLRPGQVLLLGQWPWTVKRARFLADDRYDVTLIRGGVPPVPTGHATTSEMENTPPIQPERHRASASHRTFQREVSAACPPIVDQVLLWGDWPHRVLRVRELCPGRYLLTLRRGR